MKYIKNKKAKASTLISSLIIMSIVLIASLDVALVAGQAKKSSIGTSKSVVASHSTDSITEQSLEEIRKGEHSLVNQLNPAGLTCRSSGVFEGSVSGETYKVELLDSGSNTINCDSSESLGNIEKIKVMSTSAQAGRAIEASVSDNIENCDQLQELSKPYVAPDWPTASGYYSLSHDIDCSNVNGTGIFFPIQYFTGVLDGKGYVIRNLRIDWTDSELTEEAGLIRRVQALGNDDVIIKNLGIEGADVRGNALAGILAGHTQTEWWSHTGRVLIDNCYTTGTVRQNNSDQGGAGGLIGIAQGDTTISNSYSTADVYSSYYAGGLLGSGGENVHNHTNLRNSYFGGRVLSGRWRGGLIGLKQTHYGIDYIVEASYYDSTKNPLPMKTFGICGVTNPCDEYLGKTTEEMQEASTYSDWDFDNIWQINEGSSYPSLRFQGGESGGDQCPAS